MSTTVLPKGRMTRIRAAYETTIATNPGSGFSELHSYAHEIKPNRPLVDDDVLGAGFPNNTDDRPAAPNIGDPSQTLSVPLDIGQIGFWLGAFLGRVSAAGTTPKTHSFTSGVGAMPTLSIEREFLSGAQYEGLLGAYVTSMKFPFGPSSGYQQIDVQLGGCNYVEPYTSTAAGSPLVETLSARVAKSVGVIKVGAIGSAAQIGSIISGDLTITADCDADRYVGNSGNVSLVAINSMSFEWNLQARYNTDALRAYGSLGSNVLPTAQEFDLVYSLGANSSLTLVTKNTRVEPVSVPVTNGKSMSIALKGRGEVDSTNAALLATLVNSHATY